MTETTLENALNDYGLDAYLITVGDDGPHTSSVTIELKGAALNCSLGRSAQKNIVAQPNVSLFWPPLQSGGYGIIVNGKAEIAKGPEGVANASISPSKSVFHRPGEKQKDGVGPCQSDCIALKRA